MTNTGFQERTAQTIEKETAQAMAGYDITVIYAYHKEKKADPGMFPAQSLTADRIQWLPVFDDNIYAPRENALKKFAEAKGRFTILLDENDKPEPNFLEKLLARLEGSNAVLAMPSFLFPKVKRVYQFFLPEHPKDVLVDLSDRSAFPPVFPTELHGLLIRTKELQDALARAQESPAAEKQALLYLFYRNPRYLYLGTMLLTYAYPRECDFEYYFPCNTREWYYDPFEKFLLPALRQEQESAGQVNVYLQCLALYMIQTRIFANIDNRNRHVIAPEEVPDYSALFSDVLQYVNTEAVLCRDCATSFFGTDFSLLAMKLKEKDFSYRCALTPVKDLQPGNMPGRDELCLSCDSVIFSDLSLLTVRIQMLDYRNGQLEIDGEINDIYRTEGTELTARFDGKDYSLTYNQRYSLTKCFGVSFTRYHTFHTSIPLPPPDKERMLLFVLHAGGKEYQLDYAFPCHTSRFTKDFPGALWQFGKYAAYWLPDGIHIRRADWHFVLFRQIRLWWQMWVIRKGHRRQIPLKALNFLLRPYFSRQKIWLFLDKIYKGGDSSEYLYRYTAAKKDGIKKYYLLDPSSADYARMRRDGYRPLKRDSLKHKLVFLNANLVIASNSTVVAFNGYNFRSMFPFRSDIHFDVACVQHGMSVQKIALAQQRLRDNTRLYFCASKYEIENLSKPVYDYVGYDALKLTGVPRYDGLQDRAQKIILISPTWRMNSAMTVSVNEGVARDYNPNFRETNYYKVYNGLINDPRLLAAARQYGYRIQYVLHPIVSPQCKDFTKNDLVEIIPSIGDMSYEKLFCEAALMVTDFSGVQFDFAYMRKPVVYLHHEDIPQHYDEGTFHYATMSFGEICHTNDELIDVLCKYMKNDCVMPEKYRKRADDFFAFSDHHNCERIYPIMLEHERSRVL